MIVTLLLRSHLIQSSIHLSLEVLLLSILNQFGIFLFPLLDKDFSSLFHLFPILLLVGFHPAELNCRFDLFYNFQNILGLIILRLDDSNFFADLINVDLLAHWHDWHIFGHLLFFFKLLSLLG